MVPDWTLDGEGSDYYDLGPNATDDFFAFDPQGSVAERLRVDEGPYSLPPNSWAGEFVPYLYDEAAYDAYGDRLLDQVPDYLGDGGTTLPAPIIASDAAGYEAQWGYQTDPTSGLLLAGHRYYQPQTRRWLNRDPTGYAGGINLYEYADDDPVNEADPNGDSPSVPWWLTKAGWGRALHRFFLGSDNPGQPVLGSVDQVGDSLTPEEAAPLSQLNRDPQGAAAQFRSQATSTTLGFLGSLALGAVGVRSPGSVSLDTNALIPLVEGSSAEQGAVLNAVNGRSIYVSKQVLREFLKRGDAQALRSTINTFGIKILPAAKSSTVQALTQLNVKPADARAAAAAIDKGIPLLTRDIRLDRKIPGTAEPF